MMKFVESDEVGSDLANEPPVGKTAIVYLGPVAPHWDIQAVYGDAELMDAFHERVHARLLLLPPHDPQFRCNRDRVIRDADSERITVEWNLGHEDAEQQAPEAQDLEPRQQEPESLTE